MKLLEMNEWRQLQLNSTIDIGYKQLFEFFHQLFGDFDDYKLNLQWNRIQHLNKHDLLLYGVPCCLTTDEICTEIDELETIFNKNGGILLKINVNNYNNKQLQQLPILIDINSSSIINKFNSYCLKLTRNNHQLKHIQSQSSVLIYGANIHDIEQIYPILIDTTNCTMKLFESNSKLAIPEHIDIDQLQSIVNLLRNLGVTVLQRDCNDFQQLIKYLYRTETEQDNDHHAIRKLIKRRSEFLQPTVLEIFERSENLNALKHFIRTDFEMDLNGFILPQPYDFDYADLPALVFPFGGEQVAIVASKLYEPGLIDLVKHLLNTNTELGTICATFRRSELFGLIGGDSNQSKFIDSVQKIGGYFDKLAKLASDYDVMKIHDQIVVYKTNDIVLKQHEIQIWNIPEHKFDTIEMLAQNRNLKIDYVHLANGDTIKTLVSKPKPFNCVLVANRGEIAVRIMRTLKRLDIKSIGIYSKADQYTEHVAIADESILLSGDTLTETYLNSIQIIDIAKMYGADAIIPGYGFLSENAEFARACSTAGLIFIGPSADTIELLGLKHSAREIARQAGVPLVPGTDLIQTLDDALTIAEQIQYPVMLKSTAGGGGIGLQKCDNATELRQAYDSVKRLGNSFFNNDGVFLEKFIANARHIEVQIFGDGNGNAVQLGERDCSLQRRNQKLIEMTPASNIPLNIVHKIHQAAVNLAKKVNYKCAGTVEFMYDDLTQEFYFLEVNTRLQVEHPITEEVTGLDLVEWMLLIAADILPDNFFTPVNVCGSAVEVRVYAENPVKGFIPSPGQIVDVKFPRDVRVDTWISKGTIVSSDFDPMIAKIIVHGKDQNDALAKMRQSLNETQIYGIITNIDYLKALLNSDLFTIGPITTKSLDYFNYCTQAIEILDPGSYTSIQDYPGRINYWHIGVPPSGPMDCYAFQLANRIVGNHSQAPAMEITLFGPTIVFHSSTVVAVCGGNSEVRLDDELIQLWAPVSVKPGQKLQIGKLTSGCRSYLAVRGGFDVPEFLGSRSTFALGNMGGFNGRVLKFGDVIFLGTFTQHEPLLEIDSNLIPQYTNRWNVGVMYGPHGCPDFFKPDSIKQFLNTEWTVHYNSNRFGVRLIGPKPDWARNDGGEAGLHPSNEHDYVYPLGGINFTGDEPVILTCDGPSLGGFVCPFTVVEAEMWKIGQVKPGDLIQFTCVDWNQAIHLQTQLDHFINNTNGKLSQTITDSCDVDSPILHTIRPSETMPKVVFRQAGDRYILVEYGDSRFDLQFTYRIYQLTNILNAKNIKGIVEISPGVRSVTIQFNGQEIKQLDVVQCLINLEQQIEITHNWTVPSRVLYLPLAFEDTMTLAAVDRYRETIRSEAPWLPNNVDFLQQINRLDSREDIRFMLYEGTFMVLGLGDVFLGAPCAIPLDPRHRLLGTKYNPSRTFTPNGTVGIGGMYMCIYTMESPGGYQLVGRTVPIWDKLTLGQSQPWLLSVFDQIKYYPVTEQKLAEYTELAQNGKFDFQIVNTTFDYGAYTRWLKRNNKSIMAHNKKLQQGNKEMAELIKIANTWSVDANVAHDDVDEYGDECVKVYCDFVGRFWKKLINVGDTVVANQPLLVIEAMKAEMIVTAPRDGQVLKIYGNNGDFIQAGDIVAVLK